MAQAKQNVTIEGRRIALSNPDKVLYPGANFTKKQVLDYYVRVSRFLLPHLKDRPITMLRYPDGVRGEHFYEKNAPRFTPEWIKTLEVPSRGRRPVIRYILVNDLPALVWLANLASLEIHPFLHRAPDISLPTSLVFDLDPGTGSDILTCGRVALLLRKLMRDLGLESFAKVSGSKGLQIYVPLNSASSYDVTSVFAKGIARLMEEREPDLIVSKMTKSLRAGKVLIDWSQNNPHKTTVSVYSLRGKSDIPYVSMPVTWEELSAAIGKGDASRLYWDAGRALKRLEKEGDLFQSVLDLEQQIPEEIAERLGGSGGAAKPEPEGPLRSYRHKRDFSASAEPSGRKRRARSRAAKPRFVVQKHAARRLHYDFRLESGGVLWSWAVPKGPPFRKGEKRLAVHVEDHPVDYLDFEGIIPKGQYGGGTVMVWDIGPYDMLEQNLRKGHIRVRLHGRKLSGEWLLTRTRSGEEEKGENWLMIKAGESATPPVADEDDRSAISGRTIDQIAGSAAALPGRKPADALVKEQPAASPHRMNSLPKAHLEFQKPMTARLTDELPREAGWAFEIKLDGYRALALRSEQEITILSRRGNRLHGRFPEVATALEPLPPGTIADGEIVALDRNGRTSFALLQKSHKDKPPIYFYLFDLLAIGGKDLRKQPYSRRRDLLERHVMSTLGEPIRLSESFQTSAAKFLAAAKNLQAEGVIAKRLDSKYESGERSNAWLKYKLHQSQEMVIGGYIPGPNKFDALLAGYYSDDGLRYVAKVRNGFVPWLRRKVAENFRGLESEKCPFINLPEPAKAARRGALTKDAMKSCRWLKPELVAQIEFAEWTPADRLRNARFAGLRDDKDAFEAVREQPLRRSSTVNGRRR